MDQPDQTRTRMHIVRVGCFPGYAGYLTDTVEYKLYVNIRLINNISQSQLNNKTGR